VGRKGTLLGSPYGMGGEDGGVGGTAIPTYCHIVDGHAHCSVVVDLLRGHALGLVRQEDAQQQQQPLEAVKYPWGGRGGTMGGQTGTFTWPGVGEPWVVKQGPPLPGPPWVPGVSRWLSTT